MYFNPSLLYQSNGTQYNSSQSKANCNENVSMPLRHIYVPTSFPAYTQVFDFERNETMLSDHFSNLFLYEQIWKPLGAHTTSKAESSFTKPSLQIQSPVAHSTPRPIRKLLKNPLEIQNVPKDDKKTEYFPEQNGVLRTKKADIKMSKPKQMGKAMGAKSSLNSSSNSLDSFSPKSNSNQRKLPLRSQGIDMSQFLNKNSEYGSSCESSFLGTDSSLGKYKNKEKVNVQNKCLFCENNGESPEIYMSHPLKDSLGKVVCPVLRNYECPKCGESGDYAHTNKYCPETQRKQKENKIKKFFNQRD